MGFYKNIGAELYMLKNDDQVIGRDIPFDTPFKLDPEWVKSIYLGCVGNDISKHVYQLCNDARSSRYGACRICAFQYFPSDICKKIDCRADVIVKKLSDGIL